MQSSSTNIQVLITVKILYPSLALSLSLSIYHKRALFITIYVFLIPSKINKGLVCKLYAYCVSMCLFQSNHELKFKPCSTRKTNYMNWKSCFVWHQPHVMPNTSIASLKCISTFTLESHFFVFQVFSFVASFCLY